MKFHIVEEAYPHRVFTAAPTREGYTFEPLGWQDFIDFFHKKKSVKISVRNAYIVGSENGSVFTKPGEALRLQCVGQSSLSTACYWKTAGYR